MTVAFDTNILVYARREETAHHRQAKRLLARYAEGDAPWALPWPCVYEFLRVVTHPKVFHPPTPMSSALADIKHLLLAPSLMVLTETDRHFGVLDSLALAVNVQGNIVHDAHIAALLLEHGVDEILTADDDFRRFPRLKVTNPFR
ncbi:MAG: PIN domain-containing protein [Deltaproteobacteria bacterium]|nr:PIN domain-containing protein [Deltaproteobacteria bacterium]